MTRDNLHPKGYEAEVPVSLVSQLAPVASVNQMHKK